MASTLERLFLFAKATAAHQRENFTTETLAGAIRSDPAPFFAALRAKGLADGAEIGDVLAETQLWLPGTGRVDLTIEHGLRGARRSIWIEVKVHAPVDHEQLARYHARAARESVPPQVALLAREPPPHLPPGVGAIAWQDIWASIRPPASGSQWADFKVYLEEIEMADPFLTPVTPAEAASLDLAVGLLGKVTRILTPFAKEARTVWERSMWNVDQEKVREEVCSTLLGGHGTASINSLTGSVAGAAAGARTRDGGGAELGLWVWIDPRLTIQGAERVCRQADEGGLDATWQRHAAGWEPLRVYHRLDDFSGPKEASAWLVARLRDLDRAGVLALLDGLQGLT